MIDEYAPFFPARCVGCLFVCLIVLFDFVCCCPSLPARCVVCLFVCLFVFSSDFVCCFVQVREKATRCTFTGENMWSTASQSTASWRYVRSIRRTRSRCTVHERHGADNLSLDICLNSSFYRCRKHLCSSRRVPP